MEFPDNYFDHEVRDGFFVPGIIKRAWAAEMEVLNEIDKVCKKHGIRWFADYGTLLGAVRHGGFVPWDDDMDICMLREDYDRFNEVAKKELSEDFYILNVHDAMDFDDMITRVNNDSKVNYTKTHIERYHQFPYPAGVDIFALDYIAPNEEDENFRKEMVRLIVSIIKHLNSGEADNTEMLAAVRSVEQFCNIKFDEGKPLIHQLGELADRLFALYSEADGSTEVALMNFWVENNDHKFKLEYYKDIVKLPFENMTVNAPAMYDALLKDVYGDYMRLVHAGGMHDYPYFGKAEDEAEKVLENGLPYRYYFSSDDLQSGPKSNVNIRSDIKEQIKIVISSLVKIHKSFWGMTEDKDVELVLQLLAKCQDIAINMGKIIENTLKNTEEVISVLEEYCETIYNMYELLSSGEAGSVESRILLCKIAEEALDKLKNYSEKILRRREVVFLPYKASLWDSFDGLWREYMEDEDWDVYVIPIPYIYKSGRGEIYKECYEGNEFPEEVAVTDYKQYDFQQRHPDEVYIQCPYDKCNAVLSMEPYFYSDNIKQYTDKLVLVPPFIIDEINEEDGKALKNARDYICTPGVMHADKVIVQSEQLKNTYVKLLTEFAGEDTRAIWEKKIDGSGLPRADETALASRNRLVKTLPWEWQKRMLRDDGKPKKVVVFKNNVSAILQYKEQFIKKLSEVLDTFKENRDSIVLLWTENPLVNETIKKLYPLLWEKYSAIIDSYKEDGWGIYDECLLNSNELAIVGDAYYGDTDSVIQKFIRAGKPVMVQNVEIR